MSPFVVCLPVPLSSCSLWFVLTRQMQTTNDNIVRRRVAMLPTMWQPDFVCVFVSWSYMGRGVVVHTLSCGRTCVVVWWADRSGGVVVVHAWWCVVVNTWWCGGGGGGVVGGHTLWCGARPRLVATLPMAATWHLLLVVSKQRTGGGTHLG